MFVLQLCARKLGVTDWKDLHLVQQSGFNLLIQDEVHESESISLEEFKIENGHSFLAWNCDSVNIRSQ